MVMERLEAARKLLANQGPEQQKAIALMRRIAKDFKVVDPGPKLDGKAKSKKEVAKTPEQDLEAEWQLQASRYIELGFHHELGLTKEQYFASLPKFEPQPGEYKGKFDLPLLVETRIPWTKQAELADIYISDYLRERIDQTSPHDKRSQTPYRPYTGYFNNWGQRFPDKIDPFNAREKLAHSEVGAGPYEAIALQVAHPELTRSAKYFDLIGYNVESDYVPVLRLLDGRPRLDADWGGHAGVYCRPLVRGNRLLLGNWS